MELILNTYGSAISRDNEAFVISTKDGRQRIPTNGINSIQIGRGAQISSDAVMLAIEKEIAITFMDRSGELMGRIWSPRYGSISTIRKGQLNFVFGHEAIDWIRDVICRKIENQQALMLMLATKGDEASRKTIDKNIARLEDYRDKVKALDGEIVTDIAPQLRGWEGRASAIYFSTMNYALPEPYRFSQRSQHPATDVTNAFLNYWKIRRALTHRGDAH